MAAAAAPRLFREYKEVLKNIESKRSSHGPPAPSPSPDDDLEIILFPKSADELFTWSAYILGPVDLSLIHI